LSQQGAFATEVNRFHDVYEEVLKIILDIKTIMNLNNLTKVGYLIDTSTSIRHDPAFNPDIMETGVKINTRTMLI
jgi:hypothetical protein